VPVAVGRAILSRLTADAPPGAGGLGHDVNHRGTRRRPTVADAPTVTARILVVDDEASIVDSVTTVLR
jgi:hypothetical protein